MKTQQERELEIGALIGAPNYTAKSGELQMTLPQKVTALEDAVIQLSARVKQRDEEIAALKAKEVDVETRSTAKAVEIAAAQGVKTPVAADKDKGNSADTTKTAQPTGVEAVAERYRKMGVR